MGEKKIITPLGTGGNSPAGECAKEFLFREGGVYFVFGWGKRGGRGFVGRKDTDVILYA